MADPDPSRCPLCEQPNRCAMACRPGGSCAQEPCWCTKVEIPATLLARVPANAAGKACVCAACVARHQSGHARV